ncbi:hypothetical protein PCE1_002262 [Barthelona sp. PCE]
MPAKPGLTPEFKAILDQVSFKTPDLKNLRLNFDSDSESPVSSAFSVPSVSSNHEEEIYKHQIAVLQEQLAMSSFQHKKEISHLKTSFLDEKMRFKKEIRGLEDEVEQLKMSKKKQIGALRQSEEISSSALDELRTAPLIVDVRERDGNDVLSTIRRRVHELMTPYRNREAEFQAVSIDLEQKKQEIAQLKDTLIEKQNHIQVLTKASVSNVDTRTRSVPAEESSHTQELRTKINELESANLVLQEHINMAKESETKSDRQYKMLVEDKQYLEKEVSKKTGELRILTEENTRLRDRNLELQNYKDESQHMLLQELQNNRLDFQQVSSQELQRMRDLWNIEREKQRIELIEGYEKQMNHLKHSNDELLAEMKHLRKEKENIVSDYHECLGRLRLIEESTNKRINELIGTVSAKTIEVQKCQLTAEDYRQRYLDFEDRLDRSEKKVHLLRKEVLVVTKEKDDTIRMIRAEHADMRYELQRLRELEAQFEGGKPNDVVGSFTALSFQITSLRERLEHAEKERLTYEERYKQLEQANSSASQPHQYIVDLCREKEAKIGNLERMLASTRKHLKTAEGSRDKYEGELKRLLSQRSTLINVLKSVPQLQKSERMVSLLNSIGESTVEHVSQPMWARKLGT